MEQTQPSQGRPVRRVVVVGGGTAGWLAAGTIAAAHRSDHPDAIEVTLVESPDIPIIGVGEGTWPTMRRTLEAMGISETEFIRRCDVSFKQGADFRGWATDKPGDHYYHPLVLPAGFIDTNLVPQWQEMTDLAFADAVSAQPAICDAHRAPKQITTPEFAGVENYAYHLNAGTFSTFLTEHCTQKLGVRHVLANVVSIDVHEDGDIRAVQLDRGEPVEGDLFIDCTGFRSLLLGEHFGVPFIPKNDVLFVDRAIAVQVPYESEDTPIASHTISTAQSAGWVWDIGLSSRRGVGHVYSSSHQDEVGALEELKAYLRPRVADVEALSYRTIPINSGHRERFWVRNCVGVGLAAGFLEPLEASALVLVELSAQMIAQQMPVDRGAMDVVAARFNRKFRYRWDRIVDFLKLHYCLTRREDSAFWIDNRRAESIPDSLAEMMELWRYQSPWLDDFDHKDEVFPAASWQYVLYGMGFETRPSYLGQSARDKQAAAQLFTEVARRKQLLLSQLPTNRDLLGKIQQFGMQAI